MVSSALQPSRPWHEQDAYWEAVAASMFTPQRWREAARDVARVMRLVGPRRGASVLDLGCGAGIHALELGRCGYRVLGVDRTRRFVDAAARAAAAEGLPVEFTCEDMRTFVRPSAFDVAISLYTSFGYFEDPSDERRVVTNLFRSLRAGGTVLIDTDGREVFERGFTPRFCRPAGDAIACEERTLSADHRWVHSRVTLHSDRASTELRFQYRLYSARDLSEILCACGFVSTRAFGGLDGRPYDDRARRLVILARR